MRKLLVLIALGAALLLPGSCNRGPEVFTLTSDLFDLESGERLTARQAARSAGVYGVLCTELFDAPQYVSFIRLRPEAYSLNVVSAERELSDSTSALCLREGALAGINGSYFNMRELTQMTLVWDDGVQTGETAPSEAFRSNGVLLVEGDGCRVECLDSIPDGASAKTPWELMVSGPLLRDEGEELSYGPDTPSWESFYEKRHPRSMVGMDEEGFIWLVAVDGRFPSRAEGMSIAEMTALAGMLGLCDALNLDGGGSTTLWTRSGGVLNHPCDNGRYDAFGQRRVPNVLSVSAR